jgi:hypothetical protein
MSVRLFNTSNTKCPKCEATNFEIVDDTPFNSIFELTYLRCGSCKTFLNSYPVVDTNSKIDALWAEVTKRRI